MPSGIKFAVCVGVYDLGTHFDRMYDKERHSGVFIFEVPSERITITKDGEDKDLPRQISNRYTLSLGEKANLRRDLESWRGRGFSEEELDGFNILAVLGAPCQLLITHKEKQGAKYPTARIGNIMSMPKGVAPAIAESDLRTFSFEDGYEIPEGTPKWIIQEIQTSNEWIGKDAEQPAEETPEGSLLGDDDASAGAVPPSDEIPF